ncbi:MAG: fumarylacetoacetate hydrolase family protein [Caldilineaceae bacterium]
MHLSRHQTASGPRWAADGYFLPSQVSLGFLLELPAIAIQHVIKAHLMTNETATGELLPPLDAQQEVWASGVTYLRSRDARKAESTVADVYQKVYEAERPELFLKALGWRVVGHRQSVAIRPDSTWDVPEPELTLVINRFGEIIGYTAGNDMSSRSIEGENPLYLPQAKIYNRSCALGPQIILSGAEDMRELPVSVTIERGETQMFEGSTSIAQMKRNLPELADWLVRQLDFPQGVLLMTGTGSVPPESFTLKQGDVITIQVGELTLQNSVG